MAKRVVWTETAIKARRAILEYWSEHNQSKTYSKKLSTLIRKKIQLLRTQNYIGKPTNFKNVRATLVNHFTIFYQVSDEEIVVVGLWDNRRNPEDLKMNLEIR